MADVAANGAGSANNAEAEDVSLNILHLCSNKLLGYFARGNQKEHAGA